MLKTNRQNAVSFILFICFSDYIENMKYLPSIKQLQYLVALAETRHFSKAAENCNVTQSTLSAGIRDLETVFGVALAERTKRSVIMTAIGVEIAERAANLIRDAEDMMDLTAASSAPLTGRLQLGVIPTIAPYLLPKILPALRQQYPQLNLGLRETQTAVLVQEVLSGKLDLALLALPASDNKLVELALFEDPFVLLTPAQHRLQHSKEINATDLENENLLLLEEGHCFRDQAIEFCTTAGLSKFASLAATSLATVSQMVSAGFGLTLLPQMALEREVSYNNNLIVRPFSPPQPSRRIGLVWRKNCPRVSDFQALADLIKSVHAG